MIVKLGTLPAVSVAAGAAMLVISAGSASAFTLSSPSVERPSASQIDKVWWRGGGGWHGGGWHGGGWHGGGWHGGGWGGGWRGGWGGGGWGWRGGWGGPGWGNCWRGYYGRLHCN
jgi:hypothetical protein